MGGGEKVLTVDERGLADNTQFHAQVPEHLGNLMMEFDPQGRMSIPPGLGEVHGLFSGGYGGQLGLIPGADAGKNRPV